MCALTFHLSDIQMIITSLACIHSYKITTTTSYSDTICCSLLLLTVARLTRTCVSLLISHLPLFEMQISVVVQVGTRFFFSFFSFLRHQNDEGVLNPDASGLFSLFLFMAQ